MADTLIELAERCEKAVEPDRELDFAILCVVDPRALKTGILPGDPKFTSSLDAAMTLVPDGAWWWVEAQPLGQAFLAGAGDERVATAATPALALCAAALRARAAMKAAA